MGQEHLTGTGSVLRKAIESGIIPSMILWGPPGVGKTTLARIIANTLERPFYTLSAISSGVKDVREVLEKAQKQQFFDKPGPILFIDEIHRFNKAQQDSLLGAVEAGVVSLIGATTENPSFEVISPLLSRCQVYVLKHLEKNKLLVLAERAIQEDSYLKKYPIRIEEEIALLQHSGGDARKLYNILELVVVSELEKDKKPKEIIITDQSVTDRIQQKMAMYDKGGEQHYDIISAYIKSIRGSDPQAAVYWLARMVEGGEELKFIARRLLILAAEDIGLANPNALMLAQSAFEAVNVIGWPESRIILSQITIYLAASPKSNSAYKAISDAQGLVKQTGDLPVPLNIRNAPAKLMKELDYGKAYKYAHDYEGNFAEEEFMPEEIKGKSIWKAGQNKREGEMAQRMKKLWKDRYNF